MPEDHPRRKPTLGVLAAFRTEVSTLAGGLASPNKTRVGGRAAWRGGLGENEVLICAGGMGPERSAASARALVERGVSALLCVGAAGGLDPALKVGDLLVAEWVLEAGEGLPPTPCDGAWLERVRALASRTGVRLVAGGLVSVARPVSTPEAKARLAEETGALAVDME
ncbi:MAG: hypothetical protein ACE5IM_02765, partial [Nitrospinota bacterium]